MLNDYRSKSGSVGPGLYVHVPFCRTKCNYCSFNSEPVAEYDAGAVVCAMIAEMEGHESLDSIKTIYIGGGSPSSLTPEHLLHLINRARLLCPTMEEFTVEINPSHVNKALLSKLRSAGVNRLSIGVQSFIQRELDLLGRRHTVACIHKAVRQIRAAGFDNISLDLIFAVPGSDLDSWKQNLHAAIELKPDHISTYNLTYEDKTPLSRDLAAGVIRSVDEDTDRAMYELAIDELTGAGFVQYEISNFARKGFECKHNLNYWTNGGYVGIGPGATSYLQGTRSTSFADITRYCEMVRNGASTVKESETHNSLERACETAVLNLRRMCGIDLADFRTRTGFNAMQLFAESIRKYQEQGLIEKNGGRIFLTRQALGIADSILCDFSLV